MVKEYNLNAAFLYMQQLLTAYKNEIKANQYNHGIYVVEQFYNWYHYNTLSADELYAFIECNDNLEADCILNYAEYCQIEDCEMIHYMWEIMLSTLMVIVYIAYQRENAKYVPQDIEVINPDKIGDFFKLIEVRTAPKELFEYFQKEVCY